MAGCTVTDIHNLNLSMEGETMSFSKTLKPLAVMLGAILAVAPLSGFADDLPVKIGFAAPLTGVNAGYGKDLQNGVQLALDEANAQKIKIGNQVANFQIVAEDDQADPRVGVQAAQKLVDSGVSVVVGHFNSGTTIPASQLYETAGIPVIDPAATNPIITGRGFANTFMVISTDAQNAGNAGVYAVEVTKAKRIAIFDDRTAFGQGEADEFEKAVKAHGGNIVAHEYTNNQAVDFSTQLTAIKAANADLIFFGGLDTQAAGVAKRMKQLGLTAQLVGGGGVMDPEFIKLAGDASDGAMAWEYGRPLAQLPGSRSALASTSSRMRRSATTRRGRRSRRCSRPSRRRRRCIVRC
jgi:branched-chain amino acid transport system substrate-binding protein